MVGITKMSWSMVAVGVLLAIGQILQVVLSVSHGPADQSLQDFNHVLIGVFVLLVGGKAASNDKTQNGGGK